MIDAIGVDYAPNKLSFGSSNFNADNFKDLLINEIKEIDKKINIAEVGVQKMALGEDENIHRIMLDISKARTSFELAVQVRNRVIEGVQELLRMSI